MSIVSDIEQAIGYAFRDRAMLEMALTHASMQRRGGDNERLEFLGDRVAGLVLADMLYRMYPDEPEGLLARRHAAMVQKSAMAEVAAAAGFAPFLRLSSGELRAGGARKDSILANAAEAVLGAVYLDGGYAAAEAFVKKFWTGMLGRQAAPPLDPKTALQEWAQARGLPLPEYELAAKTGADHAPVFEIALHVDGVGSVTAAAASKRAAEKDAAQQMLNKIEGTANERE